MQMPVIRARNGQYIRHILLLKKLGNQSVDSAGKSRYFTVATASMTAIARMAPIQDKKNRQWTSQWR
jgi:hypothetical protein